jgi:hypothetical protein
MMIISLSGRIYDSAANIALEDTFLHYEKPSQQAADEKYDAQSDKRPARKTVKQEQEPTRAFVIDMRNGAGIKRIYTRSNLAKRAV